ncbi:MAG: response regulator transcription factor [Chloroflexi bacterium]|nr:response regulator transcription factor [Chloroflexota bacterium]
MNPITILLADDHTLIRAGIRALLQKLESVQVVGEAANGLEAVRLAEELHPEIVLMDLAMPEMGGFEATSLLAQKCPAIRVIILSMHLEPEYVMRALQSGAKGYLLKGARIPELELAITSVANDETYLSPAASKLIVGEVTRLSEEKTQPLDQLTPRQKQVLKLIAEGFSTKEIAQKLGVGVKTVKTHRAELMEQLDIHEIAGLVRFAIRVGLVSADQ